MKNLPQNIKISEFQDAIEPVTSKTFPENKKVEEGKCCDSCTTINHKGDIKRTLSCLDYTCFCHSPKEEIPLCNNAGNDWRCSHCVVPSLDKEEWEEELPRIKEDLRRRFGDIAAEQIYDYIAYKFKRIISEVVSSERNRVVEKIRQIKKNPTEDQEDGLEHDEGYDKALDDIISFLQEKE